MADKGGPLLLEVLPETDPLLAVFGGSYVQHTTKCFCEEKLDKKQENAPETLAGWLRGSGHWEEATFLDECALRVEHRKCENGHDFYFRKFCGKEWCPTCGKLGSWYHKRRVARAKEHFIEALVLGNLTVTMPKEISEKRLDKAQLRVLQGWVAEDIKSEFGFGESEVVVHLLGKTGKGLHVHFEALFNLIGCFNRGQIAPEKIESFKIKFAQRLCKEFGIVLDKVNARYSFALDHEKKHHKLSYIHRPICTEEAMLALSVEDREYILSLKGYHRQRYYGDICNSKLNEFMRKHWAPPIVKEMSLLERRCCPKCKTKTHYVDTIFISEIPKSQVVRHDHDTWIDRAVDAWMRADGPGDGKL